MTLRDGAGVAGALTPTHLLCELVLVSLTSSGLEKN